MAAIASALQNPKQSDITQIEINGRKAYRFTTSGFTGGYQLTYLQTVVVGSTVVVFVTTWTTSPNFDHQRSAMEELASDLTGL